MFLKRILILLSLLVTHSVAIVVLEKCKQCVNKGCGLCSKTTKNTRAYDQTVCTCDKNEFNYGQKCNDFKTASNSWGAVQYHTVKMNTSFGCHLHAHPAKTKSLLALFGIFVGGSILGLIAYMCRLHCPKRGRGSVGNKALLLEPDHLENALDEAEKVVDTLIEQAAVDAWIEHTESAVDTLKDQTGQVVGTLVDQTGQAYDVLMDQTEKAVGGVEKVFGEWTSPPEDDATEYSEYDGSVSSLKK
jgi:hypothetical protein